jgi:hypothetical protein
LRELTREKHNNKVDKNKDKENINNEEFWSIRKIIGETLIGTFK